MVDRRTEVEIRIQFHAEAACYPRITVTCNTKARLLQDIPVETGGAWCVPVACDDDVGSRKV
jgi:hypothetical protein